MNLPLFNPADLTAEARAEWIATRREPVVREGFALRAGTHAAGPTIEVKSLTTNAWLRLELPDRAIAFVNESERDAMLRALNGEAA